LAFGAVLDHSLSIVSLAAFLTSIFKQLKERYVSYKTYIKKFQILTG